MRKPRHGRPVKAWAFRMIEKMSVMTQTVDKVKSLESDHVENITAHWTKYANLMGLIMNNYGMRFLDIRNTVPRNTVTACQYY